jgi:hypothetical protein
MTSTRTIFCKIDDGTVLSVAEFCNFLRQVVPKLESALEQQLERTMFEAIASTIGPESAREALPNMLERHRDVRKSGEPVKDGTLSAIFHGEFVLLAQLRETLSRSDLRSEHLRQIVGVDLGGTRLRDLFEMREETSPTTTDLLNLRPLHAFMRIERAENVSPITIDYTPPPNIETRAAILERMDAQKRASSPPPEERPTPPRPPEGAPSLTVELAPPATPPRPPKSDDDYTY